MVLYCASLCTAGPADPPAVVVTREPLSDGRITNRQCGQFIEYLCDLVPGIWGEKLCDGSFEGLSPYKFVFIAQTDFREHPWYPSGQLNRASYALDGAHPMNGSSCQKIEVPGGAPCTLGISQDGISISKDQPVHFSIWLRQVGVHGPVEARLHHEASEYARADFNPTGEWRKYDARLVPSAQHENATLTVTFHGPGTLWLDCASLMPEKTIGGWRPDVVKALRALRPGVIRFGGSALDDPSLGDFEWRDTVGDVEHRKPFRAWGGLQPPGAGLEQIVQLMQTAGAEPIICVRVRQRTARDAADEVEYFNGPADSPMGKLRAAGGHSEPYHIRYWQIGNEQRGSAYERLLPDFCRAMKKADPHIVLLASYPTPAVLRDAGEWIEYVCPHHYDCGDLAATMADFDRVRAMIKEFAPKNRSIHIAVTEWNTTAGDAGLGRAKLWTLANALACARYQNLLHRQCDLADIACRSNLCNSFCSGIIQTDNRRLYKTPTYYMQQLYATLAGERPLKVSPAFSPEAVPDFSATLAADGSSMTLFAVNWREQEINETIDLSAFAAAGDEVSTWTLADRDKAGEPDATNSFDDPERVAPAMSKQRLDSPRLTYRFPALSITVLRVPVSRRR